MVGAGVLGLCTAWALARRGHAVTVLEAGSVPDARASSSDEGRIIRHAYGTMEGYAAMMPAGFAAWRALFAETGADRLVPCRAVYALRAGSRSSPSHSYRPSCMCSSSMVSMLVMSTNSRL